MYKNVGYNQHSNQYQRFNQPQNKYQGRPQGMHANQGYNQQPHQYQRFNQQPIQYQGRPNGMCANLGYNQQQNQFQGNNQPQHQFHGYNQPHQPQPYSQGLEGMMPPPLLPAQYINQSQQNVTVQVQVQVPSGSHSGQGLAPNPLVMPEDRGRVRGPKIGKGGHGFNENKHEKLEDENALENQKKRGNGRDRGRGRGGKRQLERKNEHEDGEISGVDDIDVFKFLIKSFGGGCTFEDFLRRCELFPMGSNICSWFKKHSRRFHVFWDENDIVYIQPFYQEAKICTPWNNKQHPGQCQNSSCDFFHICRRFIRGSCKESSCPLSHSFRNPHNRHLKNKLGISDFSEVDIRVILNCNSLSICADYIYNDGCKVENGEKRCPHLHFCEKKIFGNCKDQCKKTHSITQFHNKWVLGSWNMSRWQEVRVLKSINVPPRQRKENDNNSDDSDLSQHEDDAVDTSIRYDSDVRASSEGLSSTASCDPKFKQLIISGESRSIEDVKDRRKMKPVCSERFKSSEDSICGIVGKDDQCLPKVSAPQEKYDADDNITKDGIIMKKNKQEKQGATSSKVVKPKPPPKLSKLTPSDPDYQERNPDLLKDETEISEICIFVSKDKCPSASCKNLHLPSGIPYLWQIRQIKMFGKWFSLTLAENEKIEKGYCDLLDEVKYNGSKYSYHIWFSKMQAIICDVDGQPAIGDNKHDQWCNVRRLSTPSFTEKKMMVDSYPTQWRWYWKDDSEKWNMYSKDDLTLERKYQTKKKTHLYTMENNHSVYMIDFQKMIQVNVETDRKQNITRRPLFVSKDDVNEKKIEKNYVPPKRVSSYPNAKGYSDHYKHLVDDDDDLYKGSDFVYMDKSLVPPKADSSDGH
ncbi:uncharacterized protein LOC134692116 [Mytilus trossulus]|uniref:uncharacterized protein LOC134692116 n=1 Tax=Mytilus trossulus TaxID=6551 RepID=UPI003005383D